MKITKTFAAIVLMTAASTTLAFAESKKNATAALRYSKVMGTIQSINPGQQQITIRDYGNKNVVLQLGSATKTLREATDEEDVPLQIGDRVSVRYDIATKTALRIDVLQPLKASPEE